MHEFLLQITMHYQIIGRKTEEEIKINSRIIEDFVIAFMASDVKRIGTLLHTSGKFFGRYNKNKTIGYFHRVFFEKDGIQFKPYFQINTGISLDPLPGAEVIEIRCSDEDIRQPFGKKAADFAAERVFHFCFTFLGGRIFSIEQPKSMQKDRKKLIQSN